MKRTLAVASLVAVATTAAAGAHPVERHPAHAAPHRIARHAPACRVAPVDEYFGRMKLSVLGIRNTIKDQGKKVDADPGAAPGTASSIGFAEESIRDWEHKYPCDRWIPWTLYALEHFYGKIHTEDGVRNVRRVEAWLRHDYPHSTGVIAWARKDEAQAVAALDAPPVQAPVADEAQNAAGPVPPVVVPVPAAPAARQ